VSDADAQARKKRRGRGEGGVRRRPDGRWEATVDLGVGGARRRRKFIYGRTKAEVTKALADARRQLEEGVLPPGRIPTVGQFLEAWLASARDNVRRKTYVSYEGTVRLHIVPWIGRVRIDKLTPVDVQSLLSGPAAGGRSPRTVQYRLQVLRIALNRAVKWGLVSRNVAALVDGPRVESRPSVFLSRDDAARFLAAASDHPMNALYTVALSIGLRQGEALGLTWADIDLDEGAVDVRHQLQRISGEGFRLVELKTTKSRRRIKLPEVCIRAFRRHVTTQREMRLFAGPMWLDSGLVFTNSRGGPLHASTVTKQLQRLLLEAGLPRMRFHDLRHSAGSLLQAQHVPMRVISEVLGHSRMAVTADIYTHVLPELVDAAAVAMDEALGGQLGGQRSDAG
jgi:integrase